MKKVAIYLISDGIGGAEQVVIQIINRLSRSGSIFLIVNNEIAMYFENLLPSKNLLNIGNIFNQTDNKHKIIRLLFNNRIYSFLPWIILFKSKKILDYLIDNQISIIHSHLDYALYSSLNLKKLNPPFRVFHTVHGVFGLVEDKLLKPFISLSKIDFKSVDKLIFVSQYVHNVYKNRNIPFTEFEIIYNGIDLKNIDLFTRNIKSNEKFEILYVGGSKYVKGYDILIETVDLLQHKIGDRFQVVVIGPINAGGKLKALIKERNLEEFFILIGFVEPPEHLNYFKSAHLLFMPSRSEALPIAAIEAITLDLPIIASNVGGVPEIIKHGENGLLGNNDPEEYSEFMVGLISNYTNFYEKAKNYNSTIKIQFEAKNMCQQYLDLYLNNK